MKSIVFIINPIPVHSNRFKRDIVLNYLPDNYVAKFKTTQYPGHARELAEESLRDLDDIIICVGGDGTAHEIVQVITGTDILFGVFQTGPESSVKAHLNMPKKLEKALDIIIQEKTKKIDTFEVENEVFGKVVCLTLIGYGVVANALHDMTHTKTKTYLMIWGKILQHFVSMKYDKKIQIRFNYIEKEIAPLDFLIANLGSYQKGMDFFENLKMDDGVIDLFTAEKISFFRFLYFALSNIIRVPDNVLDEIDIYKADRVTVYFDELSKIQIDSDPYFAKGLLEVTMNPKSLNLIVP